MEAIQNINLTSLLDTLISLATAFVLGGLIGFERQYRQRTAGLRTNVLVAVGAAIFVDMANHLHGHDGAVHVVAYVVSGIGFLGAGVIMREQGNVRGLNTAATLWGSAAVGACAGADLILEAAISAVFVLAANTLLRPVVNRINRQPIDTPAVRRAIGSGFDTKTITLSCGKLTTGITVPQWSSILMLRNLKSPETYFQAAFRVQSPWSIMNPNGDDPSQEEILKPVCFVFDFAPTRALRQLSEYGIGLSPNEPNPEKAVTDLVSFLPVLAYDGANMTQIDAGGILDIAMAGTSATLLARKWESALLVNVDNDTLRRILDNPEAMAAVERIEGWRSLGDNIIETIINKSEKVKALKNKAKDRDLTEKQKRQLTEEEREYKSKRKLVQEKLIKFATRIPAFMYLTDFRENTLQDVITKLEPELFLAVTGLTVKDFHLLVRLRVFNTEQMNQAVFAFRRYEDASLRYTGIESHEGLTHYGLYDTVVARE
jgi:uncharacterized membrane protein YhiD involved in acid resistance